MINELAFVVHLSALERVDRFEMGISTKSDTQSVKGLRYRFSYQPSGADQPRILEPVIQSEKEIWSRNPELLSNLPTFISTDWLDPISPVAAAHLPFELEYSFGTNVSKFSVLTVPIPADLRTSFHFQINVFSATRTREAKFNLLGRTRV